jgi:hypothetical protein
MLIGMATLIGIGRVGPRTPEDRARALAVDALGVVLSAMDASMLLPDGRLLGGIRGATHEQIADQLTGRSSWAPLFSRGWAKVGFYHGLGVHAAMVEAWLPLTPQMREVLIRAVEDFYPEEMSASFEVNAAGVCTVVSARDERAVRRALGRASQVQGAGLVVG